jgi:hypothetical protein
MVKRDALTLASVSSCSARMDLQHALHEHFLDQSVACETRAVENPGTNYSPLLLLSSNVHFAIWPRSASHLDETEDAGQSRASFDPRSG